MDQANALFLAMFAVIALGVLGAWLLVAPFLERRRKAQAAKAASLTATDEAPILSLPVGPKGVAERFDRWFTQMVERTGLNIEAPVAAAVVLLAGVALGGFVFVWRQEEEPWLALPGFLLGAGVAWFLLWWQQRAWRRTLAGQMPDTFFLLSRALRAGRSLEQSFQLVGEQGVAPLRKEFARMSGQMELGLPMGQVLETTARRLNIIDFNIFAALLTLQRPTGGNLPTTLDQLAITTRERNQFEGRFRAATVLGRYSAALILFMVGVLLIYFLFYERELSQRFFDTATGMTLFVASMSLEALGVALLFWFLRYEY